MRTYLSECIFPAIISATVIYSEFMIGISFFFRVECLDAYISIQSIQLVNIKFELVQMNLFN